MRGSLHPVLTNMLSIVLQIKSTPDTGHHPEEAEGDDEAEGTAQATVRTLLPHYHGSNLAVRGILRRVLAFGQSDGEGLGLGLGLVDP
jgi:hypothetical protein